MRTASYTDTSFCFDRFHFSPSEEYQELQSRLVRLPSDTPCRNVSVDYSLVRADGSGEQIRYAQDAIPVRELLRVLRCAAPRKNNPLPLDEVQRCWMLNPQDKV